MTHPTTDALYDALGPAITSQDPNGVLLRWLDGPGSLLGEVDDVVRDTDTLPGWAGALTSEDTARVRWTAQFLGVVIPDGTSDTAARALIRDRPATRRGTRGALIAAAQQHLTGTRHVEVVERDGGAYRVTVRTYAEETPDAARVVAALADAKPAGLILTHTMVSATSFNLLEAEAAETFDALEATPAETFNALEG